MIANLIAVLISDQRLVDIVTGNTLFVLSAGALILVGAWVMLMRSKHQKM